MKRKTKISTLEAFRNQFAKVSDKPQKVSSARAPGDGRWETNKPILNSKPAHKQPYLKHQLAKHTQRLRNIFDVEDKTQKAPQVKPKRQTQKQIASKNHNEKQTYLGNPTQHSRRFEKHQTQAQYSKGQAGNSLSNLLAQFERRLSKFRIRPAGYCQIEKQISEEMQEKAKTQGVRIINKEQVCLLNQHRNLGKKQTHIQDIFFKDKMRLQAAHTPNFQHSKTQSPSNSLLYLKDQNMEGTNSVSAKEENAAILMQNNFHQQTQCLTVQKYLKGFLSQIDYILIRSKYLNAQAYRAVGSPTSITVEKQSATKLGFRTPTSNRKYDPSNIGQFLRDQELKWLKLKGSLETLKKASIEDSACRIEGIILEARSNHQELKELHILDSETSSFLKSECVSPLQLFTENTQIHTFSLEDQYQYFQQEQHLQLEKQPYRQQQSPIDRGSQQVKKYKNQALEKTKWGQAIKKQENLSRLAIKEYHKQKQDGKFKSICNEDADYESQLLSDYGQARQNEAQLFDLVGMLAHKTKSDQLLLESIEAIDYQESSESPTKINRAKDPKAKKKNIFSPQLLNQNEQNISKEYIKGKDNCQENNHITIKDTQSQLELLAGQVVQEIGRQPLGQVNMTIYGGCTNQDEYINLVIELFIREGEKMWDYYDFRDRLSQPLGLTFEQQLKCMSLMIAEDQEGLILFQQSQNHSDVVPFQFFSKMAQNYPQILINDQFQSPLNNSIFDFINETLDFLRPYSKKGIPPFSLCPQLFRNWNVTIQNVGTVLANQLENILTQRRKKQSSKTEIFDGGSEIEMQLQTRQIAEKRLDIIIELCDEIEKEIYAQESFVVDELRDCIDYSILDQ